MNKKSVLNKFVEIMFVMAGGLALIMAMFYPSMQKFTDSELVIFLMICLVGLKD